MLSGIADKGYVKATLKSIGLLPFAENERSSPSIFLLISTVVVTLSLLITQVLTLSVNVFLLFLGNGTDHVTSCCCFQLTYVQI